MNSAFLMDSPPLFCASVFKGISLFPTKGLVGIFLSLKRFNKPLTEIGKGGNAEGKCALWFFFSSRGLTFSCTNLSHVNRKYNILY